MTYLMVTKTLQRRLLGFTNVTAGFTFYIDGCLMGEGTLGSLGDGVASPSE